MLIGKKFHLLVLFSDCRPKSSIAAPLNKRTAAVHTFWKTQSHLYVRRTYQPEEYRTVPMLSHGILTAQNWILCLILMPTLYLTNRNHVEEIELNICIHTVTRMVTIDLISSSRYGACCFSDHFTNLPLWYEQTLIHCPFLGIHWNKGEL